MTTTWVLVPIDVPSRRSTCRGVAEALDDGDRGTTWWYEPLDRSGRAGVAEWIAVELGEPSYERSTGLVGDGHVDPAAAEAATATRGAMATSVLEPIGPTSGLSLDVIALPGGGPTSRLRSMPVTR